MIFDIPLGESAGRVGRHARVRGERRDLRPRVRPVKRWQEVVPLVPVGCHTRGVRSGDTMGIIFIVLFWVLWGYLGGLIGRPRKCGEIVGGLWGLLLGPFGVLVVFLYPLKKIYRCPYCKSKLLPGASVCSKCGREIYATVRCPGCGKPIKEQSLVVGDNSCPWCNCEFTYE